MPTGSSIASSTCSGRSARASTPSSRLRTACTTTATRTAAGRTSIPPSSTSHFCDFEDLLTHDGCTGVAVVAKSRPMEVQFDEHKLLFVYARDLRPFRKILRRHGVRRRDGLRLVAEGEHLHRTTARNASEFEELCCRLGIADFCGRPRCLIRFPGS